MELVQNQLFAGRYRLIEVRGRGSFGEVWLARDEQVGNELAIKIYIALPNKQDMDEFISEYKIANTLNHPNLLHADYFGEYEHRPYIIMPYCPGSSASMVGKMKEEDAWRFLADVGRGLAYLHGQDIIHRDIKPDNVLMDYDGKYVITDFGVSKKMRSTLRRNSTRAMNSADLAGTVGYMAPELFSSHAEAVQATDIWALGVTLYELLTGDLPFMGQGGGMQLHGAEIPDLPEKYTKGLQATIQACLAKDPWDRPKAEELAEYAQTRVEKRRVPCPWLKKGEKDEAASGTASDTFNATRPLSDSGMASSAAAGSANAAPSSSNQAPAGQRAASAPKPNVKKVDEKDLKPWQRRNWFISFWLILCMLGGLVCPIAGWVDEGFSKITLVSILIGLAYVGGCIALWLNERIGISIVWVASALNLWQNWLWQYEYPWDYFGQLFAVILIGMTLLCMFFLFIQRRGKSGWKLLDDDAEFWGVCKVLIGGYLLTLLFSFNIGVYSNYYGDDELAGSAGVENIRVYNQSLFYTGTLPSWCKVEKEGLKGFKIKSDAGTVTYLNFSFGQKSNFRLHYNANTTGKARDCRITVKSVLLEDEDVFVYNQKAYASYLRVNGNTSSESLNFSSGYDSETVSVATDGEYEIEELPSWCSISNQTKNSFTLSCSNNSSTSSRSGSFSVNAGSYSVRVNVSQAGKASYLRVNGSSSTQYYDVSASSQTKTFNVSSSDSYYVRNLPSWCSVTNKYSGSFGLKINANKSSYRSDWFTVECGGKSVRIYIQQAGNSNKSSRLMVNGSSQSKQYYDVSSSAQTQTFTVSAPGSYKISYLPSWCTVTDKYSNSFKLRINANTTDYRSDWFSVVSGGEEIRVYIRQTAAKKSSAPPKATISNLWVEHNVYEDGKKGMRIHFRLDADNMKGKTGRCSAYFHKEDGTALVDLNDRYCTTDGKVGCGKDFTPRYENDYYEDFTLFMPYSELHISRSGSFKFYVTVWYNHNTISEDSAWTSFTMTY